LKPINGGEAPPLSIKTKTRRTNKIKTGQGGDNVHDLAQKNNPGKTRRTPDTKPPKEPGEGKRQHAEPNAANNKGSKERHSPPRRTKEQNVLKAHKQNHPGKRNIYPGTKATKEKIRTELEGHSSTRGHTQVEGRHPTPQGKTKVKSNLEST